jgi:hypothetical protein
MWRDKFRAAGLHLGLSLCIAAVLFTLFVKVWYPPPLLQASGGGRLMLTILAVDAVLGPLLTFAVYRRGKPGLRFDISFIAFAQMLALAYGLHIALQARPVFIAVLPMRATLVRANDLHHDPAVTHLDVPLWGPRYVAVRDPSSGQAKQQLLREVLAGEPDIDFRPFYYSELQPSLGEIAEGAATLQSLVDQYPHTKNYYEQWALKKGYRDLRHLRYLPMLTPGDEVEMILDPAKPAIVGIAEFPSSG